VARLSDTIIPRAYAYRPDHDVSDNIKATDEYFLACREAEALLTPASAGALTSFGGLLQNTMGQISKPGANTMEIWGAAEIARRAMLAVVRRELQLEQGVPGAKP